MERNGKNEKLALIALLDNVQFHFVIQPNTERYGTAVPVVLAKDYVNEDESVVVLMGDDFIYNDDGSSELKRLIGATPDGECGLLATQVALKKGGTYGLIVHDENNYYEKIVDQPIVEDNPPSNLVNISKYILNKRVIEIAAVLAPAYNGECQLPEAVNQHVAEGGRVKVVSAQGQYLVCVA